MIKLTALTILVGAALAIPASALETWTFTNNGTGNPPVWTGTGAPNGGTVSVTAYQFVLNGGFNPNSYGTTTQETVDQDTGVGNGILPENSTTNSTCETSTKCYLVLNLTSAGLVNNAIITLNFNGLGSTDPSVYQGTSLPSTTGNMTTDPAATYGSVNSTGLGWNGSSFAFKYTTADEYIAISFPTGESSSSSTSLGSMTATPEPAYFLLLGLGLSTLVMFRRRGAKTQA